MSSNNNVQEVIKGTHGTSPRKKWLRRGIFAAVVVVILGGGLYALTHRKPPAPTFTTAPVKRGDVATTVTASGTLQPTTKVDIGSELSGTVARVLVDYNDRVTKGQVLAVLDTRKLDDTIAQGRANVQNAQAKVEQARADVEQAKTNLARLEKVAQLSGGKLPAGSELDDARSALANKQAALSSAQASVVQLSAVLRTNETDLTKASIKSPINGTVLTRSVEPGQTVAASLQAVTLFTIAEDLAKMELNVAVAEADVGQVKEGLHATFNVDAYPTKKYNAVVRQVRYGSTVTDNVVTYSTILTVNNDDLTLRPGMTATADIVTAEATNALVVPAAALRFTPQAATNAGGPDGKRSVLSSLFPMPGGMNRPKQVTATGRQASDTSGTVWVLRNGHPEPIQVSVGLTDGRYTVVSGEGLTEGMQVITAATSAAAGAKR
ncbi:efflux RND transporter periplasmic adaptor subunit [Uliginosibacterium sp. sgz301328]|uniref:efflux RND transporter periplasmic adaptor subunit n=1 Tax=Uliginosibacterium sp. sgz301328 TaxID=3243764 RepID=UPI00359E187E